jgi:hypothetical protein
VALCPTGTSAEPLSRRGVQSKTSAVSEQGHQLAIASNWGSMGGGGPHVGPSGGPLVGHSRRVLRWASWAAAPQSPSAISSVAGPLATYFPGWGIVRPNMLAMGDFDHLDYKHPEKTT